jgi:ABC-type transport system substrate-binding protein
MEHGSSRFRSWGRVSRRDLLRRGTIGVVSLGLAGCTGAPASPTAAPVPSPSGGSTPPGAATAVPATTVAQAKYGGALKTIATNAERTLDPHMAGGAVGGVGNYVFYSQLLSYKWGPDVQPPSYTPTGDLAESWTQPDDLTYVFELRPGVRFHNIAPVNGRELVADDVVFSYNRIRDLKSYASLLQGVIKMETPSKYTVKLTLEKPNADLLRNLAEVQMAVVAREQVDQKRDLTQPPVIGTGPWIFESFVPGERLTGTRNPDYFQKGLPYADRWESYRTTEPSTVSNGFRSRNLNVLGAGMTIPLGEDILKALPQTNVIWLPIRGSSEVGLRATFEPFTDLRIRQAINKAIDRKAIIDTVHLGRGILFAGITLPTLDWSLADAELSRLLARDVEGAKRLLQAAGKGDGFDLELLAPPYLQNAYVTMAELIQANLKEIGVRATIKTVDAVAFGQLQRRGDYQAYVGALGGGTTNGVLFSHFYTGGEQNYSGYPSPALDKLIDQQAVIARDDAARKKVLQDIQRQVIADAVYLPLHTYPQPSMCHPEVKGFYPPCQFNNHNLFWSTMWLTS